MTVPDSTRCAGLRRREALACLGVSLAAWPLAPSAQPIALMLAHDYRRGIALAGYGVSEKYDGLRGYWDGRALWMRGGGQVAAPAWFTAGWPIVPLDGELWAGAGKFETAVSTARTQVPDDGAWRGMRFMAFDLPAHGGSFRERHAALASLVGAGTPAWLQAVEQTTLADHAALQQRLGQVVRAGGEGLMLHRWDSPYRAGRSRDLLKFKPDADADARVLSHVAGRGKHAGVMGALWVETPEGVRFKLGTGFDDAQRRQPPAVGSWVSYRYRGETEAGVPRFASFLRVRADLPVR